MKFAIGFTKLESHNVNVAQAFSEKLKSAYFISPASSQEADVQFVLRYLPFFHVWSGNQSTSSQATPLDVLVKTCPAVHHSGRTSMSCHSAFFSGLKSVTHHHRLSF